ncbi:transglutaminase-like cysteine peptidase [Amphibiibacter pelophylacis]|uniref:Transglutaminase-like cysteine peptidase n=1 Tax=Amphibiibacter pelophylacis TaxID=1799477 RepID=A0ACC6P2Q7_9BURK
MREAGQSPAHLRQRMARRWRGLAAVLAGSVLAWSLQAFEIPAPMERAAREAGPAVVTLLQSLKRATDAVQPGNDLDALNRVNNFFNQNIQYGDDLEVWGKVDYWASPFETFKRGYGDCEDYVIAKYFTLLQMGMSPEKLRFVYVRATMAGSPKPIAHMILAYYATPTTTDPLILDILDNAVKPASQRRDLVPVFSFNTQGLWQGVSGSSQGNAAARLSPWRDLLEKVKGEGFVF